MFNSKHYVPILKWKRAEQKALQELNNESKGYITPLIQFVMPKSKSSKKEMVHEVQEQELNDITAKFKEKLPTIAESIFEIWGTTPIFIDAGLLFGTALKVESIKEILTKGTELGVSAIPVLNLGDDQEIKTALCLLGKKYNCGVCLRIGCSDLRDLASLSNKIEVFLTKNDLKEEGVDLLIDIKETDENENKYLANLKLSQKIPNLLQWRTFTFASGAFPKDLSKCKIDEENFIPRIDWESWVKQINSKTLQRNPSFSDYTILHPIYDESSQFFHPTTSIKYTLENNWLIMKGKKQKFELYLVNAKLLSENEDWFSGEGFSYGDKIIAEKARHFAEYQKNPAIKGTGSTEIWLSVGINHHLTYTANQVANLL